MLEAGFDGYLAKPIRQADLQTALEYSAGAARSPQRLIGSVLGGLNAICGGDEDFVASWLSRSWNQCPRCLAAIETALELGDFETLAAQAHGLERDQPDDRCRRPGRLCDNWRRPFSRSRLHRRRRRGRTAP